MKPTKVLKNNIHILHKSYGDERKQHWQNNNKNTVIVSGHCKLVFEQDEMREHMWVKVIKSDKGLYQGILDNHPIIISNISCGDKVIFEHEDIEDYLKSN